MRRLLPALTVFLLLTSPANAAWVWPVDGEVITPYRNGTDPYATGQHRGVDIAAPVGAPVVAAAGGDVRFAGTAGSSGLTVSIRTGDGYDTSYLHLSALSVRTGAHLSAGDRIGAVGTTGTRSAPAPHLHFGVRDAGTRHDYHDPLAFLPPPGSPGPAPEPPPGAAAPAPQPAPPAVLPLTAPSPAPTRRAAPRRRPNESPGRDPRPLGSPGRNSLALPTGRPHRAPDARHGPIPLAHRHPLPHAHSPQEQEPRTRHAQHAHLNAAPRSGFHPVPGSRSLPPSPHREALRRAASSTGESAAGPRDTGIDLVRALACAGLLLAAAVLGLKADGRRTTGRTASLTRLVRPLSRG